MKLQAPFLQLPLQFDAERLALEMEALGDAAWREHPSKYPGNYALPLIAVNGDPDSDEVTGKMTPTPYLARCPYLMKVLGGLGAVWGRTRLMKLAGGAEVTPHVDINYYWRERVRVHVPIVTRPDVRFICGGAEVNMAPGECWIFDTWRLHHVINPGAHERVHLVADTIGGDRFWEIAARGRIPGQPGFERWSAESFHDDPAGSAGPELMLERTNVPVVMTPWELRDHLQFLFAHLRPDPRVPAVQQISMRFAASWHALWARFGESSEGWRSYRELLDGFDASLESAAGPLLLVNDMPLVRTMRAMVVKYALADQKKGAGTEAGPAASVQGGAEVRVGHEPRDAGLDRPIFIVSPPRSGSTLLFETLSLSPDLHTIGGESHRLMEVEAASGALGTSARGYASNRLTAEDATPSIVKELQERFRASSFDRAGKRAAGPIRLLEKTPKNALRISFLSEVFPDALFVYLYRDPREVMASMLEAWESGRFRTYPDLPGWTGLPWSMVLIPGWRELIGRPLPDIVAAQWGTTTRILLDDFEALPPERRYLACYDALLADPEAEVRRLCGELGLRWDRALGEQLPQARYTVSAPRPDKWRARQQEVERALAQVAETAERAMRVARPRDEPALT